MPKRSTHMLHWSAEHQRYELSTDGRSVQSFGTEDEAAWLGWLDAQSSFAFQGREGRLSVIKEARPRGAGYWYAYRSTGRRTGKRYLGQAAGVTIARLEEVAAALAHQMPETQPAQARQDAVVAPSGPVALLLPKLLAPRLPSALVARPRLLQRLDAGLERRVTLVVAPAGFGKTTVVGQWLASRSYELRVKSEELTPAPSTLNSQLSTLNYGVGWVSLDSGDNDLVRFWRYVITACQSFRPNLGQAALAQLTAALRPPYLVPPLETVLTLLLNEITQQVPGGLLVLDDYHAITEPRIHETLAFFIDHLPATLRMVLVSRNAPPLPLLRWRARAELQEMHPADLRFSPEETATFLCQALPMPLSPAALTRIETMLEGWPAGLRLLTLTLQGQINQQAAEQALGSLGTGSGGSASHRPIMDYFVTEILNAQPEPLLRFLLETSVLSRLTGALCDALTGGQDGDAMLANVERAGLFLESMNGAGQWYRYHALFAEALRGEAGRRLGEAALRALSLRASHWYEQHGLPAEAIETALLAADMERAAFLIDQSDAVGQTWEPQTLRRWLDQLPDTALRTYPTVGLLLAISLQFSQAGQPDAPLPKAVLGRIEALLALMAESWRSQGKHSWLGGISAFRALAALVHGPITRAAVHAREALAVLPQEDADQRILLWRNVCLGIVAGATMHEGRLGEARQLLQEAYTRSLSHNILTFTRDMSKALGLCCYIMGELHQANEHYQRALRDARQHEDIADIGDALLGLARIAFEWNDLAAAEHFTRESFELLRDREHDLVEFTVLQLIVLHQARGEMLTAQQQMAALLARLPAVSPAYAFLLVPETLLCQGQLQLAAGDLQGVRRTLEALDGYAQGQSFSQQVRIHTLRARLLLAHGEAEAARLLIEPLLPAVEESQDKYNRLEIQLLLALAHAARKEDQAARQWLMRVLAQTHGEGFLRTFLNEGEPLARLLRVLAPTIQDKALRSYVRTILRAFTTAEGDSATVEAVAGMPAEPLSPQEQRVLRLLAAGSTNPEIAAALIISVNTVKDHIKHLYRKLGVNNRIQASEAARRLNLA